MPTHLASMPRVAVPMVCVVTRRQSVAPVIAPPTATPRQNVASTARKALKTVLWEFVARSSGKAPHLIVYDPDYSCVINVFGRFCGSTSDFCDKDKGCQKVCVEK